MQARALRCLVDLFLRAMKGEANEIGGIGRLGSEDRAIGGIMPGLEHGADIGAAREVALERLLPSPLQNLSRRCKDQDRLAEQPPMEAPRSVFVGLPQSVGNRACNAGCEKGRDIQLLPYRQILVNEDRHLCVEH